MAPYDSDSSAEDDNDYTETNVLLGYASRDPADENVSRLGGRPEWIDASAPPSAALARCRVCRDLMVLLLQLDAELPDRFPGHERRLYVFSCRRRACRRKAGSTRALRALRVAPDSGIAAPAASAKGDDAGNKKKNKHAESATELPRPPANLGETLFGAKVLGSSSGSANPFSTAPAATAASANPFATAGNPFSSSTPAPTPAPPAEANPSSEPTSAASAEGEAKALPQTFAEVLSLNNNTAASATPPAAPEPWPAEADQPAPYPIAYLSEAEYETLDPTPATPQVPPTARLDTDAGDGSGGKEDRDVFESSMDATFQRFADRLAQNPEQAIRYEFGGQPLLYARDDAVGRLFAPAGAGIPACPSCGAARAFEVQLTPRAIVELEAGADAAALLADGMDWGTVFVAVCARDCAPPGVPNGAVAYLEEWAGVQWEELAVPAPGPAKAARGAKGTKARR
ncbi:programmed cell death protein 2 [Durotheca rogersii]|uniref:programmed cell death protein 2 n=1 Tax=Durotheca rogersii TaxID=419775 RepID=UPI00221F2401|nr:programmed cell death protein 2 [Durotheca rogersii]KAI5859823.1 programmed cell death protein 2 [Durotheca rogersii]